MDDDDRAAQVRGALLKGLGVIVVIAVAIALGTTLLVRALGLDSDQTAGPITSGDGPVASPLPTSALPQPSDDASDDASASEEPSVSASESLDPGSGDIQLSVSPVIARPMERINFTGSYQGADNVSLQVQRYDDGTWSDFDARTTVRVGTFATYIMTGRSGENRFRVLDPQTGKGSNVVLVTIQ